MHLRSDTPHHVRTGPSNAEKGATGPIVEPGRMKNEKEGSAGPKPGPASASARAAYNSEGQELQMVPGGGVCPLTR